MYPQIHKGFSIHKYFENSVLSLISSTLIYASPVRSPYYVKDIDRLEIVEDSIFRFMAIRFGFSDLFINHDYNAHLKILILQSLRRAKDLLLLYMVCNNALDSSKILGHI